MCQMPSFNKVAGAAEARTPLLKESNCADPLRLVGCVLFNMTKMTGEWGSTVHNERHVALIMHWPSQWSKISAEEKGHRVNS